MLSSLCRLHIYLLECPHFFSANCWNILIVNSFLGLAFQTFDGSECSTSKRRQNSSPCDSYCPTPSKLKQCWPLSLWLTNLFQAFGLWFHLGLVNNYWLNTELVNDSVLNVCFSSCKLYLSVRPSNQRFINNDNNIHHYDNVTFTLHFIISTLGTSGTERSELFEIRWGPVYLTKYNNYFHIPTRLKPNVLTYPWMAFLTRVHYIGYWSLNSPAPPCVQLTISQCQHYNSLYHTEVVWL